VQFKGAGSAFEDGYRAKAASRGPWAVQNFHLGDKTPLISMTCLQPEELARRTPCECPEDLVSELRAFANICSPTLLPQGSPHRTREQSKDATFPTWRNAEIS
jgi:hypothetical protein